MNKDPKYIKLLSAFMLTTAQTVEKMLKSGERMQDTHSPILANEQLLNVNHGGWNKVKRLINSYIDSEVERRVNEALSHGR
jgi:hypothetical protein